MKLKLCLEVLYAPLCIRPWWDKQGCSIPSQSKLLHLYQFHSIPLSVLENFQHAHWTLSLSKGAYQCYCSLLLSNFSAINSEQVLWEAHACIVSWLSRWKRVLYPFQCPALILKRPLNSHSYSIVWSSMASSPRTKKKVVFHLKKAIDSVPHQAIPTKLHDLQVPSILLHWLSNYLFSKLQCVVFKGYPSLWLPVRSGVPQSSVFPVFTHNLKKSKFMLISFKCSSHHLLESIKHYNCLGIWWSQLEKTHFCKAQQTLGYMFWTFTSHCSPSYLILLYHTQVLSEICTLTTCSSSLFSLIELLKL